MHRTIRASLIALGCLGMLLPAGPRPALAQDDDIQKVMAEGFEVIVGDNNMIARDKAIEQALRNAVEQVAGTVVSSETLVNNFQLVSDNIYSKAKGFVKKHTILSEGPAGDGTYKVSIEAYVAKKLLSDSLADIVGATMTQTNKPRTLFMIAEQQLGQESYVGWWTVYGQSGVAAHAQSFDLNTVENTLSQIFSDNNFPIVDLAAASKSIKVSKAFGLVDLNEKAVQELGNQAAAEMVVYGKAYVRQGNQILNSPMYSISAQISVKVVSTDTGRVITSTVQNKTIPHSIPEVGGTEALKAAAKAAADEIMPKMVTQLSQNKSVELSIKYGRYGDLAKFKQALKENIRSIQSIAQRASGNGSTTLEVDLKTGTAQSLADELSVREFRDFSVEVDEVSQNTIKITLMRRQ